MSNFNKILTMRFLHTIKKLNLKNSTTEQIEDTVNKHIMNTPFAELMEEYRYLIKEYLNNDTVETTKSDTRFPITQEEFNKYFRIKDGKGRGRKPKTTTEEQ